MLQGCMSCLQQDHVAGVVLPGGLLFGLKQAGEVGCCKLLTALFLMPVNHRTGPLECVRQSAPSTGVALHDMTDRYAAGAVVPVPEEHQERVPRSHRTEQAFRCSGAR